MCSQAMKVSNAIIAVAMCLVVARMASGAAPSPEPWTIGEPGPYPAAAETPRYEHYEQVCVSVSHECTFSRGFIIN